MREDGFCGEPGGAARLKRRMVERVLDALRERSAGEIEPLLTLLRRFAAEAAREEARLFCDELVADGRIAHDRAASGRGVSAARSSVSRRRSAELQNDSLGASEGAWMLSRYVRAGRGFRGPGIRR